MYGCIWPRSVKVSPSIQLLFVEGRLAFDIDKRKAQLAGLVISSRLLRLARTVIE